MQRPIRLMQGSIRFRGAGGPLTQRQHGNPTFTPQTVARNRDALNQHIHWRLRAPVQGSLRSPVE
ncbi:MAG: hypothetical protein OXU51_10880 [Candidatus Poribacteria bacterium]|nr:hypothetical protein [Candidatus Poribacteria bacterium]